MIPLLSMNIRMPLSTPDMVSYILQLVKKNIREKNYFLYAALKSKQKCKKIKNRIFFLIYLPT